jgi:hypothetical protein
VKTDDEGGIVLFECDRINPYLISCVRSTFTVIFRSYTGLRIPTQRFVLEILVRGVYVMEGRRIRFKPISTLYEVIFSYCVIPMRPGA